MDSTGVYLFNSRVAAEDALMNWLGDEFDNDTELAMLELELPDSFPVEQTRNFEYEYIADIDIPAEYITDIQYDF